MVATLYVRFHRDGGHTGLLNVADFDPERHEAVVPGEAPKAVVELPQDGPTLEEYVAAGYPAEKYPPQGYAEKPSPGLDAFRAEQAKGKPADTTPGAIATVNSPKALELVGAVTTVAELDKLEADERANQKLAGGRKGVLKAIAERRVALQA